MENATQSCRYTPRQVRGLSTFLPLVGIPSRCVEPRTDLGKQGIR
jgi:hypothetical protein